MLLNQIIFHSSTEFSIENAVANRIIIIKTIPIFARIPLFFSLFSKSSNPSKSVLLNEIEFV